MAYESPSYVVVGANQVSPGQSTKIAMTSPVTQVPADDRFRVRFVMPTQYTAESLPVPNDPNVTIGDPIWARYDPPWKPWFLRRNEVLVELDEAPSTHPQP